MKAKPSTKSMTQSRNRTKNRSNRGFSLIEVVIALGIFATSLVVLVGVLPQNMDGMRKASSKSIQRRIAQNIIGELMLNDWDKLHLFGSKDGEFRYFDSQGIELQKFSIDAIFTARIKILPRDVNLDQNRSLEEINLSKTLNHDLPDDDQIKNSTNQHARRVVIELTDIPNENFDFEAPENERFIMRVGTIVSNFNDIPEAFE